MRKLILVASAASFLLSGCAASTQSRVMLDALIQDCNAGNPDSCAQIQFAQQQVAYEQQTNTNTAAAIGAGVIGLGLLGAVAGGAFDGGHGHGGSYHSYRR